MTEPEDTEFNLATLEARAEEGDLEAQYEMGWRHAIGMDVELDDDAAVEWLQRAAAAGHSLAQNNMGARYYSGDGVDQDCNGADLCYADLDGDGYRSASGGTVKSASRIIRISPRAASNAIRTASPFPSPSWTSSLISRSG